MINLKQAYEIANREKEDSDVITGCTSYEDKFYFSLYPKKYYNKTIPKGLIIEALYITVNKKNGEVAYVRITDIIMNDEEYFDKCIELDITNL